ncbi:MAG: aminodeoxychorismate/anthranilate synthase component I [Pirellula sp.]|nr:aminodeoxychorismate/anthranilate synthase component I [Pirellula sp.]
MMSSAESVGPFAPCDDLPLVEELSPPPDPEAAFLRFATREHCVFFDSARRERRLGRFSFLAADPFAFVQESGEQGGAVDRLRAAVAPFPTTRRADLPPFQGGAAALFGYDLGRQSERLPAPRADEFQIPPIAYGLYDVVLAWDHETNRAWLISQGFPELESAARRRRAAVRMREFHGLLTHGSTASRVRQRQQPSVRASDLVPQYDVRGMPGLTSNFDAAGYLAAVSRAVEYVYAGDIFQVNLAQRLLHPAIDEGVDLYMRLRRRNPATFAGYFDLGEFQIVSASPERFLQVVDDVVETRPIKGTRLRTSLPEVDMYSAADLYASEKDRAENVMIVDLLRNDLSRVCTDDSVFVPQLCALESYEFVQHLVSAVSGKLRPGVSAIDALAAAFPGGSITGAPKIRAMEIIAELEPTARGPYCGSLAYLGFDGTMDSSILIRTITAGRGWWQAPVGGGITAQSDPKAEYEETWHKAEGLLRALRP